MRGALLAAGALLLLSSCATSFKPCTNGGDTSWPTAIRGDQRCQQTQGPGGRYVNNGKYLRWFPDGKVAVEGQFKDGKKDGVWTQYDESGKKVLEKVFEDGQEKSSKTF